MQVHLQTWGNQQGYTQLMFYVSTLKAHAYGRCVLHQFLTALCIHVAGSLAGGASVLWPQVLRLLCPHFPHALMCDEPLCFSPLCPLPCKPSPLFRPHAHDKIMLRYFQVVDWLKGRDDGEGAMIILDECHKAKNLLPDAGSTQPTQTGGVVLGMFRWYGMHEPWLWCMPAPAAGMPDPSACLSYACEHEY